MSTSNLPDHEAQNKMKAQCWGSAVWANSLSRFGFFTMTSLLGLSRKPSLGLAGGILALRWQDKMERKALLSVSGFRGKKKAECMQNLHFLKEFEVQQKKTVWLKDQSTGKWIWNQPILTQLSY